MEESQNQPFSTPTKQSIFAIAIIIFKYIRILIRQLLPFLAIAYFGGEKSRDFTFIILIAGSVFYMFWSIISFFKFYFFLENNELNIQKGVLQKTKLNIPFERIQTVNFKQNLLHRILNVVQLEIDTAGSKGNEFAFDALSMEKANELREILLSGKKIQVKSIQDLDENLQELEEIKKPILNLNPLDLIKIGVSQNHLRSGGLIFIGMFWIMEYLQDFGYETDDMIESAFSTSIQASLIALMTVVVFFLVVSFFISLVRTVITYFDLHLWQEGKKFKLISGLFTRREKTAPYQKIQIIKWSDNPLKMLFGIFDVTLKQASSIEVAASKSMTIPGCYKNQVEFLKENWLGAKKLKNLEKQGVSIHYFYRRALYRAIFGFLILALTIYLQSGLYIILATLLIPYLVYTAYLSYRKAGFAINQEVLHISKGMFGDANAILPLYKVQSLSISQTPFQTRKKLANLTVASASGNVRIPYISLDLAHILQDFILFKVEKSTKAWM